MDLRFIPVVLVLAWGCAAGPSATAALVWSEDELVIPSGALVEVKTEMMNTSTGSNVQVQDVQTGNTLRVASWRIKTWESSEQAEKWTKHYQSFRWWYGTARFTGEEVLSKPDPTAPRILRLGNDEMVKILGKFTDPDDQEGIWYEVLVNMGKTGWVRETSIDIFEQVPGQPAVPQAKSVDPNLSSLYSRHWISEEISEELKKSQPDPQIVMAAAPFRAYRDKQTIVLPPSRPGEAPRVYTYQSVSSVINEEGSSVYIFKITDQGDIQIRFSRETSVNSKPVIEVSLPSRPGIETAEVFRFILGTEGYEDWAARRRGEKQTRYRELVQDGPVLRSFGHGEIWLEPDNRFRYLPPPPQAASSQAGSIIMDGNLGAILPTMKDEEEDNLRGRPGFLYFPLDLPPGQDSGMFTGVLSLTFDHQSQAPVYFLYKREKGGLRLWQLLDPEKGPVLKALPDLKNAPSWYFSFSRY